MNEQWPPAEVATFLGVKPATVRSYVSRGHMPPPDGQVGATPWWRPETIRAWHAERRGQGWRKSGAPR